MHRRAVAKVSSTGDGALLTHPMGGRLLLLLLAALACLSCVGATGDGTRTAVRLVTIHPHNVSAFTEGLVFDDGALIESTGLNGASFIRKYRLSDLNPEFFRAGTTQSVPYLQEFRFDDAIFGEGVTVLGDKLFALTYKAEQVLVLSRRDFQLIGQFPSQLPPRRAGDSPRMVSSSSPVTVPPRCSSSTRTMTSSCTTASPFAKTACRSQM